MAWWLIRNNIIGPVGDISARFSSFKNCNHLADLQQIDVTQCEIVIHMQTKNLEDWNTLKRNII